MKNRREEDDNVVPLESKRFRDREQYVRTRQNVLRERYRSAANYPPEKAGIAGLYFVVLPDGNIRTCAIQVEPEHVDTLVDSMVSMQKKLLAYKAEHTQVRPCTGRAAIAILKFAVALALYVSYEGNCHRCCNALAQARAISTYQLIQHQGTQTQK